MSERMDERYGSDTPQEREREATDLRAKYQALEKENADLTRKGQELCCAYGNSLITIADLKQQVADGDLAFNHANEVVGKLQAQVARLSWQPITPENLPKVGDEIYAHPHFRGKEWDAVSTIERGQTGWNYEDFERCGWTHFRPINPPIIASRTTPAKP